MKYVLIDYENVQPEMVAGIDRDETRVIVFVGASQAKVHFETASVLQCMGDRAGYVKISGSGPNALDFHIAFYIGQISALDNNACFQIISKDAGFDPLVQHLRSRGVECRRSQRVVEPPPGPKAKTAKATTVGDRLGAILTDLRRRGQAKPGSLKTLTGTIHALFQKQLSEQELSMLVSELQRRGFVIVEGAKLKYALPGG